ncbi:MAG: type IV toxin-antitoxin system AbiEi family antitoxin domain-containing protein [Proteobacteria bacterium]|nr:type IV toxin-antitoxin system AbiEi family antitoxin domain-containing protein [Pseudomonadota bacterium]MBU1708771.1 type IV toxin-antitoxin system AbiEi family antitoxin domain-containing protein [Pseudomonadota bacterium]
MKKTISNLVKAIIDRKKPGWVFSPQDFIKLSSNIAAAERALSRLHANGEIKRLRKGLYYKPIVSRWGEVPPEIKEIVKALERSLKTKMMPSGAASANILGLTTQVPAKTVFYTTHNPGNVKIGKFEIQFKKVSSKRLTGRGKKAGLILNALKYLGEHEAKSPSVQKKIAKLIGPTDKQVLNKAVQPQSKWLRESVENIMRLVA